MDDWGGNTSAPAADEQWQGNDFTISGPGRERFHRSLFAHALLGGVLAAVIGRMIYKCMYDPSKSNVVMVGLILALVSALTLLACALCELRRPRITMNHELNLSRILVGLLSAAAVFLLGCGCEFLYEWNSAYAPSGFDDYVFAIDDSESMLQTDPYELRYRALEELLDTLDESRRVGLVRFNENAHGSVGIGELNEAQRMRLREDLANPRSMGATNLYGALESSLDMYHGAAQPERLPVVVLLSDGFHSDGYSRFQFNKTVRAFLREGVVISTVSLGPNADEELLKNLAESTGGQYIEVEESGDLARAFRQASTGVTYRCLFNPRPAPQRRSLPYMALRVLFLTLPGLFIGFFIALLLRSRLANRQLLISGAAGALAGLVMEAGTFLLLPLVITQVVSWVLYSVVLLNYYDSASGLRQSKLETGEPGGGGAEWDDLSLSFGASDISRLKSDSSGRVDRIDDWGPF